ncbi:Nucleotidyl transferase [Spirochaeta thermophila DSM 6578]|uniref:Nucleotidyl transferase n=1 Tax=Winmispira thermophila (strain ATCC 700085 / DSM 6578 / Z-1203) TaxID=869211 RepID=G0GCN1_WINT7|nr:mannose-1-phosphate guanylyltransferase [Spirochaeta thermophila]AEJ60450.1 Nucleotidyl transferase [Spirochaeta thermophila DSM 6578]
MVDVVVVLAGGKGTRLWPASTEAHPKQFLTVEGGRTLLEEALLRAWALAPREGVIVVTGDRYLEASQEVMGALPREQQAATVLVGEPEGKNTAPAVMCAATLMKATEGVMVVLTADHLVRPLESFVEDVERAVEIARDGYHVTFGIPPVRPETGYGYIHVGAPYKGGFLVESFTEKPDEATARRYVEEGTYYWNSGMFVFRRDVFLDEMERYAPRIARPFLETGLGALDLAEGPVRGDVLEEVYARIPADSIDYALMERTERAAMVPARFSWSDIGSWEEYAAWLGDHLGEVLEVESEGCTVVSDLPVVLCGVEDLVVSCRNGRILVLRKGRGQLVKKAVERMKEEGKGWEE